VPYYHALVGEGYRMDHLPLLIQQAPGSDGRAWQILPAAAFNAFYTPVSSVKWHSVTLIATSARLLLTDLCSTVGR
jgi:hypothetical protein